MKLTKLNDDSSWLWVFDGYSILVDPWFSLSQVDVAPWFSRQSHSNAQPEVSSLPYFDSIFISHPFTDHCNKETLLQLPAEKAIIAKKSILNSIAKWQHFKTLIPLEDAPFKISQVTKNRVLDPVHHAFLLQGKRTTLLYAPHGVKEELVGIYSDLLIGTSTRYHLPFWLGGTVNLGLEQLLRLGMKVQAAKILTTHDERKIGEGLVEWLAKKTYTDSHDNIISLKAGESFFLRVD